MKNYCKYIVILTLLLSILSGCGIQNSIIINSDGTKITHEYIYLTEAENTELLRDDSYNMKYIRDEQIGDTIYHVYEGDRGSEDTIPQICNENKYYAKIDSSYMENVNASFCIIEVQMPFEIVNTNGTLSEDNKTVKWTLYPEKIKDGTEIYAYTANATANNKISITTKNGYVKCNEYIPINTSEEIKYISVGDIFIKPNKNTNTNYITLYNNQVKFTKDGTYTFTVWTINSCNTFTVKVR